jgi:hypothetical protein
MRLFQDEQDRNRCTIGQALAEIDDKAGDQRGYVFKDITTDRAQIDNYNLVFYRIRAVYFLILIPPRRL